MKKFLNTTGIIIILILVFTTTCFASSDNDIKQVIDSDSINNSADKNELFNSLNASENEVRNKVGDTLKTNNTKSMIGITNDDPSIINNKEITINKNKIIKAYRLSTPDIVSSYKENGSFSKLISNEYRWLASIVDGNNNFLNMVMMDKATAADVNKNTGKWVVESIGYILSEDQFNFVTDNNRIKDFLLKNNIKNPSQIKFVISTQYYTNFLYIKDGNKEYGIPFSSRPDFTGLQNGKLYNMADIVNILNKSFPSTGGNHVIGGGSNNPIHFYMNIIFISIIVLLSIDLSFIIMHFKKSKNIKKSCK